MRKEQVESVKFPMIVWNSQDENSPINVVIDENKADYNPIHQISKVSNCASLQYLLNNLTSFRCSWK